MIKYELNKNIPELERQKMMRNIHDLLKNDLPLEQVAEIITEGDFWGNDLEMKDSLDRFLDYVLFKVKTGVPYIASLAYPSMRIEDETIERKTILLINDHLIPEIIIKVLKYFSRNVQDSDTNLHLAHLIENEIIIQSIFDTFKQFKSDVFNPDREAKTLNVKRLQQFSSHTDNRLSSPLDAACRFKYILEYISFKQDVSHIYTSDDLYLYEWAAIS